MKDIIQKSASVMERVYKLMKKQRNPIPAAKLSRHTDLRAKCSNATRWSSNAAMINLYRKIKEYVTELDIEKMNDMVPSVRDNRRTQGVLACRDGNISSR